MMLNIVKIRAHERGFLFKNREFVRTLGPGWHVVPGSWLRGRVDRLSVRDPFVSHADLDVLRKANAFGDEATVLDLKDNERALVWVDGRLAKILKPGLHAVWTVFQETRIEVVDARVVRLAPELVAAVSQLQGAPDLVEVVSIEPGQTGLQFLDGRLDATLGPGTYAMWRGAGRVKTLIVDLKEQVLDIAAQDVMTSDKVTLRLNTVVTYKVGDALKAVTSVDNYPQALYREAQLALRGAIGTRELDVLLAMKDAVAKDLLTLVKTKAEEFGIQVTGLGIRDIVLPGEMKDLLNKVTEAKKAAEANLITRREEVAAMRSQANTARIFETSPMLMRLKELEVLEKVAAKANLQVVLGEKGLTDRVMKLI